jgi:hypothetical protein
MRSIDKKIVLCLVLSSGIWWSGEINGTKGTENPKYEYNASRAGTEVNGDAGSGTEKKKNSVGEAWETAPPKRTASPAGREIGEIRRANGRCLILRKKKEMVAEAGLQIDNHDTAVTKNNSMMQALMDDDAIITIGENSRFAFENYHCGNGNNTMAKMRLDKGIFRMLTGKIAKKTPERFRIGIKGAAIGVRGTDFYAMIYGDKEEVGCFAGSLYLKTAVETYEIPAGKMALRIKNIWKILPLPKNLSSVGILELQRRSLLRNLSCPGGAEKYWDIGKKAAACRCPKSTSWFASEKRCMSPAEYCSKWQGTRPVILSGNTIECQCEAGKRWSQAMKRCASDTDMREYCDSLYPGSIPSPNASGCECPPGNPWNEMLRRCINAEEYCERLIPGSIPVVGRLRTVECRCPPGTYLGRKSQRCFKYRKRTRHHRKTEKCRRGYVYDRNMGRCVKIGIIPCPSGTYYDRHAKRCLRRHTQQGGTAVNPLIPILGGALIRMMNERERHSHHQGCYSGGCQ